MLAEKQLSKIVCIVLYIERDNNEDTHLEMVKPGKTVELSIIVNTAETTLFSAIGHYDKFLNELAD